MRSEVQNTFTEEEEKQGELVRKLGYMEADLVDRNVRYWCEGIMNNTEIDCDKYSEFTATPLQRCRYEEQGGVAAAG